MERKAFDTHDFRILTDASGHGEISGYASTFANFDSVGERVTKGAFQDSLAEFLSSGFIAVGHNWSALPIATPIEAYEDDHGLFMRAAFHSTPEAQAARTVIRERLERNKAVKLSIGYEVLDDDRTNEGRLLNKLKLYEVSVVTVPANVMAAVTDAKAGPVAGLPFTEHSERVVSAVKEFLTRAEDRTEARLKVGRILSDANERAIEQAVAVLQELLERSRASRNREEAAQRDDETKADPEILEIFADFERITQRYGVLRA